MAFPFRRNTASYVFGIPGAPNTLNNWSYEQVYSLIPLPPIWRKDEVFGPILVGWDLN